MNWNACAPPPEPPRCDQRHVNPKASTVESPEGREMWSFSVKKGLVRRPATEADMRHCASCACPVEPRNPPAQTDAGGRDE